MDETTPPSSSVASDTLGVFDGFLQALPTGVLLLSSQGVIRAANPAAGAVLGQDASDLAGKKLLDWVPHQDRQAVAQLLIDGNGTAHCCVRPDNEDGAYGQVTLTVARLPGSLPGDELRLASLSEVSAQTRDAMLEAERLAEVSKLSDTVIAQAIELKRYSQQLEDRVRQRTAELREANFDAIYMLAVASEAKDQDTGDHVRRIQDYSQAMAQALGFAAHEAEEIGYSAILHDVGKMTVPDEVLKKPGRLSDSEWTVMRRHPLAGEHILADRPFFRTARLIARHHHERWDGTGYPDGITRDAIPMPARIVAVSDVFDALTSARPYKEAWPQARAVEEIRHGRDQHFDPAVVDAFDRLCADGTIAALRARHQGAATQ